MGHVHIRALAGTRRARLAAIVEPQPAARERAAAFGVPAHASLEHALADVAVDGVVITAPTSSHRGLVERCAAAGRPVLCEKPCGAHADDARAATAAAGRAGVLLQIGYYRRFVPELVELRREIQNGGLGTVSLAALHQWDEHPPGERFERDSAGIVVDMGVHEIDQLRWMTGEEVVAAAAISEPRDTSRVVAALRLSGGTLAVVTLGRRFPVPDSCWTEVIGTRGYRRLPFLWGAGGAEVMASAVAAELDAFAAAIQGEQVERPGGDDAVAALAAAELVNRALTV
jgi:myo-inositol 2-dehydrogenase/D-chiro-inositol 1-dehydrogenase